MRRLLIGVALVWLALMPPLLTQGACTAEFEHEAAQVERDMQQLAVSANAQAYWAARQVPSTVVTAEQCRRVKPRFVQNCGTGDIVHAVVPVNNRICRFYRDDGIRIQLHYDERNRLSRMETDMKPFQSLRLPLVDVTLHWGR